MRVGLLMNIPSPYRLSYCKELGSLCDLFVIFDRDSEPNRHWEIGKDMEGVWMPVTASLGVNTLDEVPDSSWYTNRDLKAMSAERLRQGARTHGTPQPQFCATTLACAPPQRSIRSGSPRLIARSSAPIARPCRNSRLPPS